MEQPIYTANYLRGTLIEYDDFIKEEKKGNIVMNDPLGRVSTSM